MAKTKWEVPYIENDSSYRTSKSMASKLRRHNRRILNPEKYAGWKFTLLHIEKHSEKERVKKKMQQYQKMIKRNNKGKGRPSYLDTKEFREAFSGILPYIKNGGGEDGTLSYSEVAKRLGISVRTLKRYMYDDVVDTANPPAPSIIKSDGQ